MKIHATTVYGWAVVAVGAATLIALTACERTPTPQAAVAAADTTLSTPVTTVALGNDGLSRPSESMASTLPYGASAPMAPGSDLGAPSGMTPGAGTMVAGADINARNPGVLTEVQPTSAGIPGNGTAGAVGSAEQAFILKTSESGMLEARLAQLAAERASDSTVKSYAAMLAQDHAATNDRLRQLATTLNVTLPTTLSPADQQTIDGLSRLSGAEFDRQFVQIMGTRGHENSIALYEQVGNTTGNASVRSFTIATLPALRAHLSAAQKLPIKG